MPKTVTRVWLDHFKFHSYRVPLPLSLSRQHIAYLTARRRRRTVDDDAVDGGGAAIVDRGCRGGGRRRRVHVVAVVRQVVVHAPAAALHAAAAIGERARPSSPGSGTPGNSGRLGRWSLSAPAALTQFEGRWSRSPAKPNPLQRWTGAVARPPPGTAAGCAHSFHYACAATPREWSRVSRFPISNNCLAVNPNSAAAHTLFLSEAVSVSQSQSHRRGGGGSQGRDFNISLRFTPLEPLRRRSAIQHLCVAHSHSADWLTD